MVTGLIALLARQGVAPRFQRPLALASTAVLAAALCGLLWTCWLRAHDRDVIANSEIKVTEAVATASASGSAAAAAAAETTRTTVEMTNEAARSAASGSADPLKSGLDRLRREKGSARSAPR